MESIYNDILKYLNSKESLKTKTFGQFSRVYSMTTENIREFIYRFDLNDKKVLSVAGSGDQMLNCILKGSRNITLFDISPLALYQVNLKKAAVQNLEFSEYMDFFNVINSNNNYHGPDILNRDLFDKLSVGLDDNIISFFDKLYTQYGTGKEIYRNLYFGFDYSLTHMNDMNNYMDKESFDKLKSILIHDDIKLDFIYSNINDLENKLGNNTYDLMMFSNISDYIDEIYDEDSLIKYHELINELEKHLNSYGTMQVGYVYNHFNNCAIVLGSSFATDTSRKEVFTQDKYHTICVNAFEDRPPYQYHDKIITYQKMQ